MPIMETTLKEKDIKLAEEFHNKDFEGSGGRPERFKEIYFSFI